MYLTGFADEAAAGTDGQIAATKELGWENIKTKFSCPDETSTRRLMGQLLASMPESIFNLAKSTNSFCARTVVPNYHHILCHKNT